MGCLRANCSRGAAWRATAGLSGDAVSALVPVEITSTAAPVLTCAPQPPSSPPAQRARAGIIEIELGGGCRVRVDWDVDTEARQIALGETVENIARAVGLSSVTIRNQLKSVLAKPARAVQAISSRC
jgi:hypothetical protein